MHPILEHLESLAKLTDMYVHPVSFATVQSYLHGLSAGCEFAGIAYSTEEYLAAAKALGWDARGSIGILGDFRRKGITDNDMVKALIAAEIGAYRMALARINSSD